MEVQLLLCRRVLERIDVSGDEALTFLRNWLASRYSKAVVLPQDWSQFVGQRQEELRGFPEAGGSYFAILRGIITPYRDKYAYEAGLAPDGEVVGEQDEVAAMSIITGRHYATCMYLITYSPETFRGRLAKFPDERIVTPELFRAEVQPESADGGARSR